MRKKKILIISAVIILSAVAMFLMLHKYNPNLPQNNQPFQTPQGNEFSLQIPKIDVDVPVVPDVTGADNEAYFKALENGVAHMKGTAKPGGGSNIFIFGHSAYYESKPGNYKKIFSDLNELKDGDEIIVRYNDKNYIYTVSDKKIVKPDDTDVIKSTKNEQLTLMTCWPIGTTKERLVIIAIPKSSFWIFRNGYIFKSSGEIF